MASKSDSTGSRNTSFVLSHQELVEYFCRRLPPESFARTGIQIVGGSIQSGMSQIGNPYDNAKAYRFVRTMKQE
ncbi:MAG: hypothetical protein WBO17_07930 [Sphingorhabdus sp.]